MRVRASAARWIASATLSLACAGPAEYGCGDDAGKKPNRPPTDCGSRGPQQRTDSSTAQETHIQTVFLILMENNAWPQIRGSADAPYLNHTLLPQASIADNYRGPNNGTLHPSEPNYLWLEAGTDFGISDDNDPFANHQSTRNHLVTMLEAADVSWKSYQEDITGQQCPLSISGNYDPKHNPMVFFDDVTDSNDSASPRCIAHVRPLTELCRDLRDASKVARYNFITPNLCNDMHSACVPQNNPIKQGDDWLALWIPRIKASDAYQRGGAIFITWDEASEDTSACPLADCPIGMFVLSPLAKGNGFEGKIAYDHGSTLKSMQKIFGVEPLIRAAADPDVVDLADLFVTFP